MSLLHSTVYSKALNMSTSVVHLRDIAKRTGFFTVWEKQRNSRFHWLMELFAESVRNVEPYHYYTLKLTFRISWECSSIHMQVSRNDTMVETIFDRHFFGRCWVDCALGFRQYHKSHRNFL